MYLGLLNGLFLLRFGLNRRPAASAAAYWALLAGLLLFSAFRFRVGCDWSGYYYNFIGGMGMDYADALTRREPLWWIVQVAANRAGLPYPVVNVLTSTVFFAGVHALARIQPDRLGFLVLLFPILIVNMPMSGIRQGAAIGLLCIALVAFLEHRPLRFVGWLLLAATIHSSAAAFLLLTPLATGRYSRNRILLTVMLSLPGLAVLLQTDEAQLAIDRYVDTGVDALGAAYRVALLSLSGLGFFIFLRRQWFRQFPADYGLASIGAMMMVALLPLVPLSSVIGDRLGYYLVPIQIMIFARIPYLRIPSRKLLTVAPYLMLLVVFAVWTQLSGHFEKCYLPYQSWLGGFPAGASPLGF